MDSSPAAGLDAELDRIAALTIEELRSLWRQHGGDDPPAALSKDLLGRALADRLQEDRLGGLDAATRRLLGSMGRAGTERIRWLKAGTILVRERAGVLHEVIVTPQGFCWKGQTYNSLSTIALRITGTSWNGPRFFGLTREVRAATSSAGGARP